MQNHSCRICGNDVRNQTFTVREMFYGDRHPFTYFQCSSCGCLQIGDIPPDMSQYYSKDYYSFSVDHQNKYQNAIRKSFRRWRNCYSIFNGTLLGKAVSMLAPYPKLQPLSCIDGLSLQSRILDVGCGGGELLYILRETGFQNVLGIDPFADKDIEYKNGLRVLKKSVHELDGQWDVIMYNHSFEHVPDQTENLQSVRRLLSKEGVCIIRVPTVSSYAWEHYREHWVQIDAPRHFFLHSLKSMNILAEQNGFVIENTMYDSTNVQFFGSELYKQDIPLVYLLSHTVFPKAQMKAWQRRAQQLNKLKKGDQAAFYLKIG